MLEACAHTAALTGKGMPSDDRKASRLSAPGQQKRSEICQNSSLTCQPEQGTKDSVVFHVEQKARSPRRKMPLMARLSAAVVFCRH